MSKLLHAWLIDSILGWIDYWNPEQLHRRALPSSPFAYWILCMHHICSWRRRYSLHPRGGRRHRWRWRQSLNPQHPCHRTIPFTRNRRIYPSYSCTHGEKGHSRWFLDSFVQRLCRSSFCISRDQPFGCPWCCCRRRTPGLLPRYGC